MTATRNLLFADVQRVVGDIYYLFCGGCFLSVLLYKLNNEFFEDTREREREEEEEEEEEGRGSERKKQMVSTKWGGQQVLIRPCHSQSPSRSGTSQRGLGLMLEFSQRVFNFLHPCIRRLSGQEAHQGHAVAVLLLLQLRPLPRDLPSLLLGGLEGGLSQDEDVMGSLGGPNPIISPEDTSWDVGPWEAHEEVVNAGRVPHQVVHMGTLLVHVEVLGLPDHLVMMSVEGLQGRSTGGRDVNMEGGRREVLLQEPPNGAPGLGGLLREVTGDCPKGRGEAGGVSRELVEGRIDIHEDKVGDVVNGALRQGQGLQVEGEVLGHVPLAVPAIMALLEIWREQPALLSQHIGHPLVLIMGDGSDPQGGLDQGK